MDYYYLDSSGKEVGPIDQDILIGKANNGEIGPNTEVRNSMVRTFKPAEKVACLEEIFKGAEESGGGAKKIAKNIHRSETSIKAPPMNYRFIAFFFDAVVCSLLVVGAFNLFKMSGMPEERAMSAFMAAAPVILMAYYAFTIGMKAQTFGYWFFGIMVITGKGDEVFVGRAFFMSLFFVLTLPLDDVRNTVRILNGTADGLDKNAMMKKLLNTKNMLYAGGALKDSQEFKGFSLVANYKASLSLFGRLYCKNETIAKGMAEQAKMGLTALKQQMQLTDQNVKVGAKGSALSLSLNLPQDKLMQMAGMLMMSGFSSGSSAAGEGEPPVDDVEIEAPPELEPQPEGAEEVPPAK